MNPSYYAAPTSKTLIMRTYRDQKKSELIAFLEPIENLLLQ